jgi:hypothetical protein
MTTRSGKLDDKLEEIRVVLIFTIFSEISTPELTDASGRVRMPS